eukprot:scaffold1000_cov166-Amphora_coffeaeformis.AAC.20
MALFPTLLGSSSISRLKDAVTRYPWKQSYRCFEILIDPRALGKKKKTGSNKHGTPSRKPSCK